MTEEVNWNLDVIHLTDNDPPQLPNRPICPGLVKLILNVPRLAIIPSTFFEHMPMLEVLDLSNTNIASLPTSISNLKLLRELSLRDCSALVELPTQIGMLSKLNLLDVKGTELLSIPTEVGKLIELEVLRVSLSQYAKHYTREANETVIPRNMISKLKKLKELCIIVCVGAEPEWWEEEVKDLQKELCHLQNLETLIWYLPTTEVLLEFLVLENLEKDHVLIYENLSNFVLTIGQHAQVTSCLPHGLEKKFEEFKNCLKWINAEGSMDGIAKIIARAEALLLSRHWTLKTLSTFNVTKLKYCVLAECNEMETLVEVDGSPEDLQIRINNGEKVGFEMLEYLSIHYMNMLQSLWKGPIGKDSFSKLRILAFHTCPELTSIFTDNLAQNLLCLKELIVEDCHNVTSVISNESHNNFGPFFPSLENISLLDLPELVNIIIGRVVLENLSTMIIYSCPQLRDFSNIELPSLKKIIGEDEWWKALDCGKSSWENIFEKLKEERDLVEQLFEATKSLQHFHDTLSSARSLGLTDMREQAITDHTSIEERGIFLPLEGYDEKESSNLIDDREQVITAETSIGKGKSIYIPPEEAEDNKSYDITDQMIMADTVVDKGKGLFLLPEAPESDTESDSFPTLTEADFLSLSAEVDPTASEEMISGSGKVPASPQRVRRSPLRLPAFLSRFLKSPKQKLDSIGSKSQKPKLDSIGSKPQTPKLDSIGSKSQKPKLDGIGSVTSVHLTMSQAAKATQNFSPSLKLGEGAFGTVYKAYLQDGQTVAIKRASKEHFDALRSEFRSKIELLAKIEHRNLVKLLGYVDEGNERLIITEYVPNGTLREHLDGVHGDCLNFNQRLEISVDIAHGLGYLHLNSENQIIHECVKSSKILLTDGMEAKVADFGLSPPSNTETGNTHVLNKVKGTGGYLDPEYMRTQQLTAKSDVYSFGVLLVEILTGRRPIESKRAPDERSTIRWAFRKYRNGETTDLVDPRIKEAVDEKVDEKILKRTLKLAFRCTAPRGADRPDMFVVSLELLKIWMEYRQLLC